MYGIIRVVGGNGVGKNLGSRLVGFEPSGRGCQAMLSTNWGNAVG